MVEEGNKAYQENKILKNLLYQKRTKKNLKIDN